MPGMFDPTPETGDESPFNSNDAGDMGDGFEIQPMPVGVLRGTIMSAKNTKAGIICNVQCNDPNYATSDEVVLFIGNDTQLLGQLAGTLGVTVEQRGQRIFLRDSEGKTDLKALEGKSGLFVFAPFVKDGIEQASVNKFGFVKMRAEHVQPRTLWESYWEQSGFGEKHEAALKKSRGGAVPLDYHYLFTSD